MSTAQDRDLNHLHPAFRAPFEGWLAAVRAAGLAVLVIETFRTPERQAYLYGQGRTNVPYARSGAQVTWTLDSLHRYGLAADVCPVVGGVLSWNITDYQRMHRVAPPERFGLELVRNQQGQIVEWPHLQLAGGQATATRLGIRRDVVVGSVWPLPKKTRAPAPGGSSARVVLIDDAGKEVVLKDRAAVYGGVLIERDGLTVHLNKRGVK